MKKTILITGSTDGIGKLAAIQLAKDGHTIYLHGRNTAKLQDTIQEVKTTSGNNDIDGFLADFSDLDAVRNMVTEIKVKLETIDVLINNAGVYKSNPLNNKEGYDLRFVVNYFAPYVMTEALLPQLQTARILNLSSAAQVSGAFEVMDGKLGNSIYDSYAKSKLAIIMWGFDLAKRLPDAVVIAVNPGSLLNTRMVRQGFGQHRSPASKGADILYDLAISDAYQDKTGTYFDNDAERFNQAHAFAYDEHRVAQLIQETEAILES